MDVILGTAGHIDHGKTSLVRALTGINCDRLEEEKRRGITIELGFAWMDLPDKRRLGIVDVPGHERFVKAMAAGASGADCVMLVIAANEGVMPQTREHLEICSLLGARAGLVALTKVDLVDKEWLELVQEDIKSALAGSFLDGAPVISVSSATGEGIELLRGEIFRLASSLAPLPKTDILRLPADRVFSMKGFGTIVTGSIISGSCALGERLCVMPQGLESRARGLQSHGVPVENAHAGQRCAVNLQGLDAADVRRGDVVARPGTLFPSKRWITRLHCLKSSPLPIRQRLEAHFHHGAKECLARIILRDRELLEPGQSAMAEIRFQEPMAAVRGDHFIIRAHSPLRTIGGGLVICPMPPALSKRDKDFAKKMSFLEALGGTEKDNPALIKENPPADTARLALSLFPAPGLDFPRLQVLTGLPAKGLKGALAALEESGDAFRWDAEAWADKAVIEKCLERCRLRAEELHRREPLKSAFAQSALLSGWGSDLPQKFTAEILDLALRRGILAQEGAGLKLAAHEVSFSGPEKKIIKTLLEKILSGGASPPFIKEIAETQGWEIKKLLPLLNHLCESGQIVKIQEGVYYGKAELDRILEAACSWFKERDELDISGMRDMLGVSRKYAVPLLEYMDAARITYRTGNQRRLRKN